MTDPTGTGVPAEAITDAADAIHFFADAVTGEPSCLCLPEHPTARYDHDRERAASVLEAAAPAIAAQAAAAERELLLAQLREFLPRYVGIVIHTCTPDGTPVYATGPVGFPDALVDTFALMTVPDADLLEGS